MEQEKWIKHYSSSQQILLVGEGDFSFAASLARAFGNAFNMVATCLHSEEMLAFYQPTVAANLVLLKDKGCTIIHQVDATTMRHHHLLCGREFDRIVFNFPHKGLPAAENQLYQIELHQSVVRGFLRNAYEMVKEGGQVHITHKTANPYYRWNIKGLGENEGFKLIEEADFKTSDFPGYENKRGSGHRSNEPFPVGLSSTYKFAKP